MSDGSLHNAFALARKAVEQMHPVERERLRAWWDAYRADRHDPCTRPSACDYAQTCAGRCRIRISEDR